MIQTSAISCNHCGQANDPSVAYCSGCQTKLRGLPDDVNIPRVLVARNLRTELHLPCMPCRTVDDVEFQASSGNAPGITAAFQTGPGATTHCDLGEILAPYANLGTEIKTRLAYGARMETIRVARVTSFQLRVEIQDPVTGSTIARGEWFGSRLPDDQLQLTLLANAQPSKAALLVANLVLTAADVGVQELRAEFVLRGGPAPRLRFKQGSVLYELPIVLALRLDPVQCLRIDTSHQLAHSGHMPSKNRSAREPLPFEAELAFRESGAYQIWLPPALMRAVDELAFTLNDGTKPVYRNGIANVRVNADARLKITGTIVPRLLPSEQGSFDTQDYSWRFPITLSVSQTDDPSAAQFEVTIAILQLWAAEKTSQTVAIDFGTSATSIRLIRDRPDGNSFSDEDSIADVLTKLERTLTRPSYGNFKQTARTALRIESHPTSSRTPDNVTVGERVVTRVAGNTAERSVSLLKRLLTTPNRPIYLSESEFDALKERRIPRIESYTSPELVESFLRSAALDLAADGCLPELCRLSYPATWNGEGNAAIVKGFLDLVQRAFQSARDQQRPDLSSQRVKVTKSLSEPEALLYFQLATANLDSKVDAIINGASTIAVVDVGGGTTDVAIVRPKPSEDGKRDMFPVLSSAFNVAGEDITHAIARELWRMLQSELNDIEGTDNDRADFSALRKLPFPDFSQQRFDHRDSTLNHAVGVLHEAYFVAEQFKLGVNSKQKTGELGTVQLKDWSAKRLQSSTESTIREIVEQANEALAGLSRKLSRDGNAVGPVAVIVGGNATRYSPLRTALREALEANVALGGPVTVVMMDENAKDGVAMGIMLKYIAEFSPPVDEKLPFHWEPEHADGPVWRLDVFSGEIPLQPLSTEPGELKVLNAFGWKRGVGFGQMQFRLHRIVPEGRTSVDISPSTPEAAEMWNVSPLDPARMKRGRIELLNGDRLNLTFTDLDGRTASKTFVLEDLMSVMTT